jgi:hypothetical protein
VILGRPVNARFGVAVYSKTMYYSLVPWVLFSVIVERKGSGAAGVAALLSGGLSLVLLLIKRKTGLKSIDLAGIITFTILAVAAFAGNASARVDAVNFGRGASTLALALVMLGSLAVVPFTEQYARDIVPRDHWGSPAFRAINRRLSLVWGLIVLLVAASRMTYGFLAASSNGTAVLNIVLNWVVPAVLLLGALTYTRRVAGPTPEPSKD